MTSSSGRYRIPLALTVEPAAVVLARARWRLRVLAVVFAGFLVGIGVRGTLLCVSPSENTIQAANAKRWQEVVKRAPRGDILDRHGRRLATSVPTPMVFADPSEIAAEELAGLAARLAEILEQPRSLVAQKLARSGRYVPLASRVHPAAAWEVQQLNHRGIKVKLEERRYYPEGQLAAQVVGFVDGTGKGRGGLEGSLEDYLRGGVMVLHRLRDRRGLDIDERIASGTMEAKGMDVHLTIDRSIQRIAERALEGVWQRHEPASASALVVEVSTGDILAMANVPLFNPNAIGDDPTPRRNRTVQDAIEPGSVIKPFTMAAALQSDTFQKENTIDCEQGVWAVGRSRIHDDHPHSLLSMSEVIKYSSTIGSAKLALRVGASDFLAQLRAFGFGERTRISLPGERAGKIRKAESIRPIELATTAFGQGMTATPLQIAMALAALANDGVRMKPRLVTKIIDNHGVPEWVQEPVAVQTVVSAEHARAIADMMVTVTEPGGTGTRAAVDGYSVAGKTGTAQKVKDGVYSQARIGSFIGFVPAEKPVLAIVVVVDEPSVGSRYGGIVAGPAFAEIAKKSLRYLGVQPEVSEEVAVPEPEVTAPARLAWVADSWLVPDLRGRSVREVFALVEGTGLDLEITGSGSAVEQQPQPGSRLSSGQTLSLVFR